MPGCAERRRDWRSAQEHQTRISASDERERAVNRLFEQAIAKQTLFIRLDGRTIAISDLN